MKTKKVLFWTFTITFLILLVFNVFIPSIGSVQAVCFPERAEEKGITLLAQTEEITNESGDTESIVTYFVKPSLKTIKHERCHVRQHERKIKFSASCSNLIGKFMRENECYIAEKLPTQLYKKIYGEISISP